MYVSFAISRPDEHGSERGYLTDYESNVFAATDMNTCLPGLWRLLLSSDGDDVLAHDVPSHTQLHHKTCTNPCHPIPAS